MVTSHPDDLEARLVTAYDRGLLVPFLGAGMSRPTCPLWSGFVAGLERMAGDVCPGDAGASGALVRRAARATRRLRHDPDRSLADVVRATLSPSPQATPPQLRALARVPWPLVLTTNYDDLYLAAAHAVSRDAERDRETLPYRLLGRSSDDCHRVLMSLRRPDLPVVWHLQGFVGGQAAWL